jgi:tetratricopeptide (TPR) repeat protein
MRRTFALLFTLAAFTGAGPSLVEAQGSSEDAEARANFEAGRVAFADARFGDALPYFERAYELSERPELLYNIGICRDRLGLDAEALAAFEGYLAAVPDAENRAEVEQRIATARQRAARLETPRTESTTDPTGWILFGSGLAVAAAGGVFLGVGRSDIGAIEGSMGTLSWTEARASAERADGFTIAGGVALGVGVALGAVGLGLALSPSASDEATVELRLGPGSVTVMGAF